MHKFSPGMSGLHPTNQDFFFSRWIGVLTTHSLAKMFRDFHGFLTSTIIASITASVPFRRWWRRWWQLWLAHTSDAWQAEPVTHRTGQACFQGLERTLFHDHAAIIFSYDSEPAVLPFPTSLLVSHQIRCSFQDNSVFARVAHCLYCAARL